MTPDCIIARGGSSTSVMAARLLAAGHWVTLIERVPARGTGLHRFYLPMPAAWMKGIGGIPVVEIYIPVPQSHPDGRASAVGQAAIPGGGSFVNGMVNMGALSNPWRSHPHDQQAQNPLPQGSDPSPSKPHGEGSDPCSMPSARGNEHAAEHNR